MESEQTPIISGRRQRYVFIELPCFLFVCCMGMTGTIIVDLIVYQTCRHILGEQHWDNCNLLHNDSSSQAAMDLEERIQPLASYILLVKTLIEGISPALLALFLGPWSDKHGRKPILIATCIGHFLSYASLSLLTSWDFNPWIYLIASIPVVFTGGFSAMLLSTFCYITDVTNYDNRAFRMALAENSLAGGGVVGLFIGAMIFDTYGYSVVFPTATLLISLAIGYVIFFVPETVNKESIADCRNPFDWNLLKELIQKSTIKRDGLNRTVLWCSTALISISILAFNSILNCGFLFTSARLGWSAVTYSQYVAFGITLSVIGVTVGMKIFKKIGFCDASIAMVGAVSSFTAAMMTAFTYKSWHLYLSSCLGIFSALISPPIRSILSKSVPPEDIGKAFSLTTAVEAILPLAANPLFTFIYSKYMPPYYPSPAHLLAAAMYVTIMVLVVFIDRRLRRDESSYNALVED